MKTKDQLLLEQAYASILTNNTNKAFRKILAEDHKLIDELIEEGFGDYLKKTGGAIKGGIQKAASKIKQTLTSGLASTLVKAILSGVPKEELENLINIIAKGQVPKDKVDQVKDLIVKQPEGEEASVKESFISTKEYLAATLFTETNIKKALLNCESLLIEYKATNSYTYKNGVRTDITKRPESGDEITKLSKEIADKLNTLYPKDKQSLAAAVPKFTDTVSKYLGLPPQSKAPSPANTSSTTSSPESSSNPSVMDKVKGAANNLISNVKGAANDTIGNVENKIPTGKGVIAKVMGFVKAHPKISAAAAAVLLGIVVAAFAGSAPVVVPALISFVKGAGIAGTTSIVKQMISGEKVDLKQAGKTALIGGVLGGVGGVLASGLASLSNNLLPQEVFVNKERIENGEKVVDRVALGKKVKLFQDDGGYNYDVTSDDKVTGEFKTGQSGWGSAKQFVNKPGDPK